MSCHSCQCDPCACRRPHPIVPPQIKIVREAVASAPSCPMPQGYETLGVSSFSPQEPGATQTLQVCSVDRYPVGYCISLMDTSGNQQVQRVIGHVNDRTLTLEAYANAYSDEDQVLTGVIVATPLAVCPAETVSDAECRRFHAITTDAFIMPDTEEGGGGSVEVCFTEPVNFPLGGSVYIEGAGFLVVEAPPSGEFVPCSECHWFSNPGTEGNTDPGDAVSGDAPAYLALPNVTEAETPDSGDMVKIGFIASETSTLASGAFELPWAADVIALWKVGLATASDSLTDANKKPHFNYHWGLYRDAVHISSAANDAEGNHFTPCTGTGCVVMPGLAAGNYSFAIQYVVGSNAEVPVVDYSHISLMAVRKVGLVP